MAAKARTADTVYRSSSRSRAPTGGMSAAQKPPGMSTSGPPSRKPWVEQVISNVRDTGHAFGRAGAVPRNGLMPPLPVPPRSMPAHPHTPGAGGTSSRSRGPVAGAKAQGGLRANPRATPVAGAKARGGLPKTNRSNKPKPAVKKPARPRNSARPRGTTPAKKPGGPPKAKPTQPTTPLTPRTPVPLGSELARERNAVVARSTRARPAGPKPKRRPAFKGASRGYGRRPRPI